MTLHDEDSELFEVIEKLAFELATEFNLPLKQIEPKRRPSSMGALGVCYVAEGRISIVLRNKDGEKWWKNRLPTFEILETLAHELAHLKIVRHGKDHSEFTDEITHTMMRRISKYEPLPI